MLRVLLVDDEPFILRGMKELIDWEDEGFEIVGSAADGEEALLFLQNHDADLILSDIKMPIMAPRYSMTMRITRRQEITPTQRV